MPDKETTKPLSKRLRDLISPKKSDGDAPASSGLEEGAGEKQSFNPMFGVTRTEGTAPKPKPKNVPNPDLLGLKAGAAAAAAEEEIIGTVNPMWAATRTNGTAPQAEPKDPPNPDLLGLKAGAAAAEEEEEEIKVTNPVRAAEAAERKAAIDKSAAKFNKQYGPKNDGETSIEEIFSDKIPKPDDPLKAFKNAIDDKDSLSRASATTGSGTAATLHRPPAPERAEPKRRNRPGI